MYLYIYIHIHLLGSWSASGLQPPAARGALRPGRWVTSTAFVSLRGLWRTPGAQKSQRDPNQGLYMDYMGYIWVIYEP